MKAHTIQKNANLFKENEVTYELSPNQEGMLLHTLREPHVALFFQQMIIPVPNLNVDAYIQAWQKVIDRHDILRTSFHWEGVDRPFQRVHQKIELPVKQLDWCDISQFEVRQHLRRALREDRQLGFDLREAPLLRVTLIHAGNNFYYVIKSHHHIILDGWSGGLILKEVQECYRSLRQGKQPNLPAPKSYRDYIAWLQKKDLAEAEIFWRKNLLGINTSTPLPEEHLQVKKKAGGERFYTYKRVISKPVFTALKTLAQRWRVTPSTLLHGLWALLLGMRCNQQCVVFGSTFTGRPTELEGVESIPGVFINVLPLRVDIQRDKPLEEWFREIHERILEIQQYEYSPLVQVQGWSSIPRGTPLFEILFVYNSNELFGSGGSKPRSGESNSSEQRNTDEKNVTRDLTRMSPTNDPMILTIGAGETLNLDLTADARRIDESVLVRVLEHLNVLVQTLIEKADNNCLNDLFVLPYMERDKVLDEWNPAPAEYPLDLCLHEVIKQQAISTPSNVAVSSHGKTLTYEELIRQVDCLAQRLLTVGVVPGCLVGVFLERSIQLPVALLGILKAGGAYLPLDPAYPADRLKYMIEDSGASIILTEHSLEKSIPSYQSQLVFIEDNLTPDELEHQVQKPVPSDLAHIIYTSGSTGRPKGTMIEHHSLVNLLCAFRSALELDSSDILLAETTLSFDLCGLELFLPLISGSRVEIVSRAVAADASLLAKAISTSGATVMQGTPTTWRLLIDGGWTGSSGLKVITGGEALSRNLARQLFSRVASLWNCYGPTETTIYTHIQLIHDPEEIIIGKSIANTRTYVLDNQRQPVPIGATGEIYIAGECVARGYRNRPDLTSERFLEDDFSDAQGARMYRSGDLGRWLPSGDLECLGRTDHQVKIRGYRIEMGEVEAVLSEQPDVKHAAIDARPDPSGGLRLIGYIVPAAETPPSIEKVREFMGKILPDFMIPSLFVILPELPLTANLKVNRKALPDPDGKLLQAEREFVAPRTRTEEIIAAEWASTLKVDKVGAHDNFFELGGHSLLATSVISHLQAILEVRVPISALFECPTVEKLATWVEEKGNDPTLDDENPLVALASHTEGIRVAPQSFAQQRLWFLSAMAEGIALYNMSGAVQFREPVDLDIMQKTLNELSRRHESLRTTFTSQDGEPIQIIATQTDVPFEVVDLRQKRPDKRRSIVQRLRHEADTAPFDLVNGPIARFKLVVLDDHRQVLFYSMHHIITDGWSMAVVQYEIQVLYAAYSQGVPVALPEPEIQYADFAIWQRNWLQGKVLDEQIDYWIQRLAGAPYLELPADRPRLAKQSYNSRIIPVVIPEQVVSSLSKLAKSEEATVFMLLLAAFQFALGKNANQDDVVIGMPIANRTRIELERVIGFFVNTLVMRTDVSGNPSFRELVRQVRQSCLDAYSHQDLPFERLVEEIAPERELNMQPLTQVLFVMQNTPRFDTAESQQPNPGQATAPAADAGAGTMFYDLTLSLSEVGQQLSGGLHYNTDLFNQETAERFRNHFITLLNNVTADPEAPLSTLSIISEQERTLLLERALPTDKAQSSYCIHELFEESVKRDSDHIALVFQELQLSYGELDYKANQLSHYLISIGVTSGTTVGLCIERGIDAIIALLAILKAGAVYVPLNPELPPERLSWMVNDSAPAVILTKEALCSSIPSKEAKILSFESIDNQLQTQSGLRPKVKTSPYSLAYIIYTSGSTGRPKGVMIEHASLCHTINGQIPLFGITPDDRMLSTIALSFDASLGEIFRTLLAGATLYLAPRELLLPGPDLINLLNKNHITMTTLVPTVLAALPDDPLSELKTLTLGGEVLPVELAKRWGEGRRLLNGYGPTEACIGATLATKWSMREPAPLGYPLPGVRAYVLGANMELLPDGVPGELYLGGAGLARGYLNQPELTAKSFVGDPFSDDIDSRLYRTGDRVRWRTDGQLAFLGRMDDQVKIKGYRIEPGEISAVLGQYSGISDAVVIALDDHAGSHKLVAYVVERGADDEFSQIDDSSTALVDEWQRASDVAADKVLSEQAEHIEDPRLNFTGWTSSYTGENIPLKEMVAWADATVNRVLALQPKKVLEIGSGSGLILLRLAPYCEKYFGLDFSAGLLKQTSSYLHLIKDSHCKVELLHRRADSLEGIPESSIDTVVINSVVQYFPDVHYLIRVMENTLPLVQHGGSLFLGDLRNFQLFEAFHASIQFAKASATLNNGRLWQRALRHMALERELLIDPWMFVKILEEWPRVRQVQILPKYGNDNNELSTFRYDVIIHLDTEPVSQNNETQWLEWCWTSPEQALLELRTTLVDNKGRLGIRKVPNVRTANVALLVQLLKESSADKPAGQQTVADLRKIIQDAPAGVEPEALMKLAKELGYRCELSWLSTGLNGQFDVAFIPDEDTDNAVFMLPDVATLDWDYFANNPAEAGKDKSMASELRDYLGTILPDYMIPSDFVLLDALPLTPHGKLDRKALPEPKSEVIHANSDAEYVEPRNDAERTLAEIWADLLRVEQVGIHDNFFDLGGDSILSIRVIARAAEAGIVLTPAQVYQNQTVMEQVLASQLEGGGAGAEAIDQGVVVGDVPLTPIQHWFFAGQVPEPHHFNWATYLPVYGGVNETGLQKVMRKLLENHDALRLRIDFDNKSKITQYIADPDDEAPVSVVDLSGLSYQEQHDIVECKAEQFQTSLDLRQGPMLRLIWFKLGGTRPDFLLLIANHLVIDVISWTILKEDIAALIKQEKRGDTLKLPAKTQSFKQWSESLQEYVDKSMSQEERDYWLNDKRWQGRFAHFVPDYPGGENSLAVAEEYPAMLDEKDTQRLLDLARATQYGTDEILLAALGLTLARWTKCWRILVNVERHGREDLGTGFNSTRTVGWFPNISPVFFDLSSNSSLAKLLHLAIEQLRTIPNHGIGYGMLKYLGDTDVKEKLCNAPEAEVFFNFFGKVGGQRRGGGDSGGNKLPSTGTNVSIKQQRRHFVEINALVLHGELLMRWSYSTGLNDKTTIEQLAEAYYVALRDILNEMEH